MQDAIVRQLQILGEAVKKLSDAEKNQFPAIPWRKIAGMRDKIIHDYFEIDLTLIWDVVQRSLPDVEKTLTKVFSEK